MTEPLNGSKDRVLGPGFILSGVFLLTFFLLRLVLIFWVHGMLESGFLVWVKTFWVGDRLAVFRPDKSANVYLFDRPSAHFNPAPPDAGDEALVKDGAAFYQTAYELYVQERLRLKNGRP